MINKFLLKNINILTLFFISLALTFYLMLPVIISGTKGIFFTLDPDAHYIGNAISYIKSHQISYINHPATPTILAYVLALTPFRLYSKLILHANFINWYILHPEIIYLYIRVLQCILFGLGLFIFSLSSYRITRSLILSAFSMLALFIFGFFTDIALHIRSETTSFLIISIWLLEFVSFIKSKKISQNYLLAAISGLAIANKFTNIFYLIATLSLIPFIKVTSRKKKLIVSLFSLFIGLLSFIFFTWPIRGKYYQILQYILNFFPQSGVSANKNTLLDLPIYLHSLYSLFLNEFWSSMTVILTFLLLIYLFIKKKHKIPVSVYSFACTMLFGILTFARYPLNYYQLTHFVGVVFVLHILLMQFPKYLRILFLLIIFFISINHLANYYPQVSYAINQSKNLDNFISRHPAKIGSIWERGDAKDFALLWGNSWSGASYSEDLKRLRPNLLFEIYFQQNYIGDKRDIFTICWDKFYLQHNYLKKFINKYKGHTFTYNSIPGTDTMYVIERNKCES